MCFTTWGVGFYISVLLFVAVHCINFYGDTTFRDRWIHNVCLKTLSRSVVCHQTIPGALYPSTNLTSQEVTLECALTHVIVGGPITSKIHVEFRDQKSPQSEVSESKTTCEYSFLRSSLGSKNGPRGRNNDY